jgi:hypothetical protein
VIQPRDYLIRRNFPIPGAFLFSCHSEASGSEAEESRKRITIDGCFSNRVSVRRSAASLTVQVDGVTSSGGATRSFSSAALASG